MSAVTLRKLATRPPEALLTSVREPERPSDDDVIDLSTLVAKLEDGPSSGVAWVEIPLIGQDGRITGVLCRNTGFDFPNSGPPQIERDAAHALSRRLLDGSHAGENGSRHPPSGREQIVDVSDLLDRTLRADVVVDTDIDPSLRRFRADPDQLHLALLNLCKNACEAMPAGGTISISARNLCARSGCSWVEIAIADDGCGMAPDVLSRMFEPYFTTKEPGKGSGVGPLRGEALRRAQWRHGRRRKRRRLWHDCEDVFPVRLT
jgi:hypothetical protein